MFIEYILCARYCTRFLGIWPGPRKTVFLSSNKEVKKVEVMGEEGTGMAEKQKGSQYNWSIG